jgi:serine/threonine protein kinase
VYNLNSYVSEGTYGAVYFGVRLYDERPVAVKIFKEVYHKRAQLSALDYDFMKEYYMHRAVADRVPSESVVKMLDTFFVRTKNGLHGAIVMEKMDGCLLDLFENFAYLSSKLHLEAFRLWVMSCRSIARALLDLHAHKIYHLDIKPGNVLYSKAANEEGIVMKLVDLGLSCYIGGTPVVPCVATGTYIPPEWRENGDKREPTYARIKDRAVLEMGEIYAMCITFSKMLKYIHIGVLKDSKNLSGLLRAIEQGKSEKQSSRYSLTTKVFVDLASALLEELNAIMPPPRLSKLLSDMS